MIKKYDDIVIFKIKLVYLLIMKTNTLIIAVLCISIVSCQIILRTKAVHNLLLAPLSIEEFRRYSTIKPIVDFRQDAGKGIIPGSIWLTTNGKFQNYMPIFFQKDTQFLAVVEVGTQNGIIARLRSAGYTNMVGWNNFDMQKWPYQVIKPNILKGPQALKITNRVHLDIRSPEEWKANGIIEGSILIPFSELTNRIKQLIGISNIIVNCAGGYRARGGWSVLQKYNINSGVLDENFQDLANEGFNIVPYQGQALEDYQQYF